jgi:hypothetical protein
MSHSLRGFQLGESYLMLFVPLMARPLQFLVPNPASVVQVVKTVTDFFEKWEFLLDYRHIES